MDLFKLLCEALFGNSKVKSQRTSSKPSCIEMEIPDNLSGLEGTLPGGNHGYGCTCWSCESQTKTR
ncbi:hypothetical protein HN784_01635 [bacterium]|nr:hypothetical protein [bacterium]MBT4250964.1 hypothetical protein [bacterium]MBT4597848.1 hypothetical protein [bacterium]MBT6753960.1 hypothetical protein [bacterium]MBT7037389.1 hypothetical protein [bacterium]